MHVLNVQRELAAFMAGVNPGVRLTPIQMREIVEQVPACPILSTVIPLKALCTSIRAHTSHAACLAADSEATDTGTCW